MKEQLPKMFQITREEIEKEHKRLGKGVLEKGQEVGNLDKDGDVIHDPQYYKLLREQEQLLEKQHKTKILLSSNLDYISTADFRGDKNIKVGHQVDLEVQYPDGTSESFTATVGTEHDVRYLSKRRDLFNGERHRLISQETPLGQALQGAEEGSSVGYQVGERKGRITVKKISISPLVIR